MFQEGVRRLSLNSGSLEPEFSHMLALLEKGGLSPYQAECIVGALRSVVQ